MKERHLSLQSACCACLTELVLNDTNAQQIVQANGIYSVGLLIMPRDTDKWSRRDKAAFTNLQVIQGAPGPTWTMLYVTNSQRLPAAKIFKLNCWNKS